MSTMTIGELVGYVGLDTDHLERGARRGQRSINELAADVLAQAKAIERQKLALELDADADSAEREIASLNAQLEKLHKKKTSPKVEAKIRDAESALARVESRLAQIRARRVQVEIDMHVAELPDKEINRVAAASKVAAERVGGLGEKLAGLAPAAAGFSAVGLVPVLMGVVSAVAATQGAIGLLPAVAFTAAVGIGGLKVATAGFGDALAEMDDPEKFAEALEKLSPAARTSAQAVKGLSPAWKAMQQSVQESFFTGLSTKITDVGTKAIPILGKGFNTVAVSANRAAGGVLDMLKQTASMDTLSTIVDNSAAAFAGVLGTARPLIQALMDIGAVGSKVFAELTVGLGASAQGFADFIREARVSGDLEEWIRGGVDAMGDLFAIIGNVGSVIGSVFRAANMDGGGLLDTVRELTAGWAQWAASAEGQERLGEIFGALNTILQTTSGVISTVAPIVADLIVWFAGLPAPVQQVVVGFVTWGSVIGLLMAKLAPLISGMGLLYGAIAGGAAKLVLGASKLGLLGNAAKTAAAAQNASALSVVGSWVKMAASATLEAGKTALAWAKTAGASAASAVADTARAVGAKLLQWATLALQATLHATKVAGAWLLTTGANAATAVAQTAVSVGQILLQWAKLAVNSALHAGRVAIAWALTTGAAAATAVAQMVVIGARMVAQWVLMAAGAMARAAIMAAAWLVAMGPIGWAIAAVVGLVALVIANWDTVKAWTVQAWQAISDAISAAWEWIKSAVSAAADFLLSIFLNWTLPGMIISHWDEIKAAIGAAWEWIKSTVSAAADAVLSWLSNAWSSAVSAARAGWDLLRNTVVSVATNLVSWVAGLPGRILNALASLGSLLVSVGRDLVNGLWNGISAGWSWLTGKVKDLASGLLRAAKSALGIASPSKEMRDEVGQWIPAGIGVGIIRNAGVATDAARKVAQDAVSRAQAEVMAQTRVAATSSTTTAAAAKPTGMMQAAQAMLARMRSGGQMYEDGTWKGAPAIVGQYNDRILDMFEGQGGRYNDPQSLRTFLEKLVTQQQKPPVNITVNNPQAERASTSINREARTLEVLGVI